MSWAKALLPLSPCSIERSYGWRRCWDQRRKSATIFVGGNHDRISPRPQFTGRSARPTASTRQTGTDWHRRRSADRDGGTNRICAASNAFARGDGSDSGTDYAGTARCAAAFPGSDCVFRAAGASGCICGHSDYWKRVRGAGARDYPDCAYGNANRYQHANRNPKSNAFSDRKQYPYGDYPADGDSHQYTRADSNFNHSGKQHTATN